MTAKEILKTTTKTTICDADKDDSQQHMLDCLTLIEKLEGKTITKEKIEYDDLFKDVGKQKQITQMFTELLDIRKKLQEEDQYRTLDPSTGLLVLKNRFDLHTSIDNYSFGK